MDFLAPLARCLLENNPQRQKARVCYSVLTIIMGFGKNSVNGWAIMPQNAGLTIFGFLVRGMEKGGRKKVFSGMPVMVFKNRQPGNKVEKRIWGAT